MNIACLARIFLEYTKQPKPTDQAELVVSMCVVEITQNETKPNRFLLELIIGKGIIF